MIGSAVAKTAVVAQRGGAKSSVMDQEFVVELERRRAAVIEALDHGVLVLFSAPVHLRNGDVEHSYRQDSDFFYLTGLVEPECALVLSATTGLVLFVREKNRERETWDGRRIGLDGARDLYGAQNAHPIGELAERLPDYLEDQPAVHYLVAQERAWDHTILDALSAIRSRRRKRVAPPPVISDARLIVHQLRLHKSNFEQSKMLDVGTLSAEAHARAMQACRPGMMEWELQNVIELEFRKRGALRLAYDSIVGSGENATILHYRENNRRMQAGDLVLIDAGAEKDYFAADITRTFPVSGQFSAVQARVYQIVLDAQLRAIENTVEGATLDQIHDVAWNVLRDGLIAEGLVTAEQQADAEQLKKRVNHFYMHRTSHYLGMDVHDVGAYYDGKSPRPLSPGTVITVEPGLYFAIDDESVPAEYRGIGIRIEDDVLVTEHGPRVLTEQVPKTIQAIEAMCQAEKAAS